MKTKKSHFLDYLAVIRPTLLFPVWTLLFLGYYRGLLNSSDALLTNPRLFGLPVILRPELEIAKTILLFSMLMGAVYIINELFDVSNDAINNRINFVVRGNVDVKVLTIEIALLIMGAITLAVWWFLEVPFYLPLMGLSLSLGLAYSILPMRLKGRPILDLLANAIGYGTIAFSLGWISGSNFSKCTLLYSLPYLLSVGATFINTTLPDLKGDRTNNDITTGVFLGVRRASITSVLVLILAMLSAIWLRDFIAFFAILLSLPLFVYAAVKRKNNVILLTTKLGILILLLITCVFIPPYFFLFAGTTLVVKLYYFVRFGVKYPF